MLYRNDDSRSFSMRFLSSDSKKGNGNTNLMSHLESHHLDLMKEHLAAALAKRGPMNNFTRDLSQDAKDYHDWIEWVVMGDHPFTFVENKYTRSNSRISSATIH